MPGIKYAPPTPESIPKPKGNEAYEKKRKAKIKAEQAETTKIRNSKKPRK